MENFKITDELFEEMKREAIPPTREEIDARPKTDNPFEFAKGDKDERIHAREDKKEGESKNN